ncbi:hypothetical protein JCM10908_001500 [Rhodotorula pacifica]|uniref:uncharacterized protein n=1 Tax=Rhodotorula pacifica TaxID=1495444 RepID=UPI00316DC7D6
MAPDIVPTSPQGLALQAAIQKKLADLGWSTEDDSVMAEYCLVMLGNRKTPDQISTELSDLIGSDFDRSFVDWLFDQVKHHYPEPSSSSSASSASAPAAPASSSASARNASSSDRNGGIPSRPSAPLGGGGGRQVFGAAMSGMKRGARDLDDGPGHEGGGGGGGRQQQRARYDGPSGGRGGNNTRSLFDRVNGNNPQFAPGRNAGPVNNTGMPQPAFDAITQAVNAILAGAHPSLLANIPFAALTAHPLSSRLPAQVMAQAQANAAMQAQAFAAMQNVWNTPPTAFGAAPAAGPGGGVFNPNAAPFQPGGGGAPGFRGGGGGRPPAPGGKPTGPPVVLPSKPTQDSICKHGVDCTRPQCPYSHPSPVATKESGLVLSSEACEKQLKCEDPDCPKAHVSKAQLTHPPSAVSAGTTVQVPPRPSPAAAAAVGSSTATESAGPLAGAGEKPCKFGAACTRPNCVFVHPWDVRGDPSAQVNCRYGAACTRADCHFKHPAHRPAPYNRSKFSATFNKNAAGPASSPSTATGAGKNGAGDSGAIAPKPTESAEHVSERLKRFANAAGGDGAAERIVPGQAANDTSTGSANGGGGKKDNEDDNKVEIHLDDEEEKKVEVKA